MTDLSQTDLEKFLRSMLDEALSHVKSGGAHTVWEQRHPLTKELRGLMVYRSTPSPTTPIVIWIDKESGDKNVLLVGSMSSKTLSQPYDLSLEQLSLTGRQLRADIIGFLTST